MDEKPPLTDLFGSLAESWRPPMRLRMLVIPREQWSADDWRCWAEQWEECAQNLLIENKVLRKLLLEQTSAKRRVGRPPQPKPSSKPGVLLKDLMGIGPRRGRPPKYSKSLRARLLGAVEGIKAEHESIGKKVTDRAAVELLIRERFPVADNRQISRRFAKERKPLQNQLTIARREAGRLTRKARRNSG